MEHFYFPNSGEEKKKVFTKNGTLFFRKFKWRSALRCTPDQSQIIGGEADEDHTQIIGGIQSNYWGGISPIPSGFRHPCITLRVRRIDFLLLFLITCKVACMFTTDCCQMGKVLNKRCLRCGSMRTEVTFFSAKPCNCLLFFFFVQNSCVI